jgi:hypothetical protein
MWGAFVTGFAEQASVEIEKTNKEISDRVLAEMGSLIKKKEDAEETALTKRDVARKQAEALKALAGKNLTETQIVGIINSGEADTVLKQLRQRTVGPERMKQLFIPADPNAQADLEQYLSEVGKLTGQAPVRTEMERGAFGLRSRAGEAARARGLAAAGMTEEELYQTRMARPEGVEGTLNISALQEDKEEDSPTIKQLQGRLADEAVKNNMNVEDYVKNTDTGKALAARIEGRRLQGTDNEEEKARTASQIRTLVNTRLQEEIAPLQFKSITYDPNLQDFVVTIPGSPEAKQFLEKRRNVAADVFKNAGLLKGNKLSDRNAADAISPFAIVDYNTLTVKSWRPVAGSAGGAAAPAAGSQPAAPAATPKPVSTPAGARPIPKDVNGKPDRSKLVAGERYASSTGDVRIWNGTSFQPAK